MASPQAWSTALAPLLALQLPPHSSSHPVLSTLTHHPFILNSVFLLTPLLLIGSVLTSSIVANRSFNQLVSVLAVLKLRLQRAAAAFDNGAEGDALSMLRSLRGMQAEAVAIKREVVRH